MSKNQGQGPSSPDVATISPADLHENRSIPLPAEVRDVLLNRTTELIRHAVTTDAASAAERAPSARAHQPTLSQRPEPQWALTRASTPSPQPTGPTR